MKNFKKDQIDKKDLQAIKGGAISEAQCKRWGGYWDERRRFCIFP